MPVHPRAAAGQTALSTSFNAVVDTADQLTAFTAAKVASYAIVTTDRAVPADCSSGPFTITLPSAVTAGAGRFFTIPKIDVSANALTIATVSGQTVDGLASITLYGRVSVSLMSDGANWLVFEGRHFVDPSALNARWFGLVGDGTTLERAALNVATAAAHAMGRPLEVPAGTYLLDPTTTAWVNVYDNLTICCAGPGQTIFKVKDNAGDYPILFGPSGGYATELTNFTLRDCTIDQNAAGNTTQNITPGSTTKGSAAIGCIGIGLNLLNVQFKDACGVNTVICSGSTARDLVMSGCTGNWVQGTSTTTDYDNSFLYFSGKRATITGNVLHAGSNGGTAGIAEFARCAFEVHGTGVAITGNTVDAFQTLSNVCTPSTAGTYTGVATVTGNVVLNANYGLTLWALASTTLDGAVIIGNVFDIKQLTWNEITYHGIALTSSVSITGAYKAIKIVGNTLTFETGDNRTVDRNGVALAGSRGGLLIQGAGGTISNIDVSHNLVRDNPDYALYAGSTLPAVLVNFTAIGNEFADCGRNTNKLRTVIIVQGSHENTLIARNRINDSGASAYATTWLRCADAELGTCTNLRIEDNEVFVHAGTELGLTFNTLKAILNGTVVKTATATLTAFEKRVMADATAGAVTINLPTAVGRRGHRIFVKKTDASGNAVTLDGSGAQTIDGAATYALAAQYKGVTIVSDAANWQIESAV